MAESAGPADELSRRRAGAPVTVWPGSESPLFAALPGESVGNYKLVEMIGEGGFSAVFLAEQSEPVQGRVALKILKLAGAWPTTTATDSWTGSITTSSTTTSRPAAK